MKISFKGLLLVFGVLLVARLFLPPGAVNAYAQLSTGRAAAIEPYMNIRATAESIAFHRKFPPTENNVSSAANVAMERYGVRKRG